MLLPEVKAAGSNEILCVQAGRREPFPFEMKSSLGIHAKHIVQKPQPFFSIQRRSGNVQALEVVQQVDLNALQSGPGSFAAVCFNAKGDEFGFSEAIISLCRLVLQHFSILMPDAIECVILIRNQNALFEAFRAGHQIQEGKPEMDCGIKIVQEITPAFENTGLVILLLHLIADVLKPDL